MKHDVPFYHDTGTIGGCDFTRWSRLQETAALGAPTLTFVATIYLSYVNSSRFVGRGKWAGACCGTTQRIS
jgi:hypothetical protein